MVLMWAATNAWAAPSSMLCEQWRARLERQAQSLAGADHAFSTSTLRVERAKVHFDRITASVQDGVCRVRASGALDVLGQAQISVYGMGTACPVSLVRAPVTTLLDLGGTAAQPKVVRSVADINGLKPKMTLCVNLDVVKGLVVDLASDWLTSRKVDWHRAIESSLAR